MTKPAAEPLGSTDSDSSNANRTNDTIKTSSTHHSPLKRAANAQADGDSASQGPSGSGNAQGEAGDMVRSFRFAPAQAEQTGVMALPFEPIVLAFRNVNYYVDAPQLLKVRSLFTAACFME